MECIAFLGHTFKWIYRMRCLIESTIYLPIRYYSVQNKLYLPEPNGKFKKDKGSVDL